MIKRLIYICLCLFFMLLGGCQTEDPAPVPDSTETPSPTADFSTPSQPVENSKTITGTVYDATVNTVTLITDDRKLYSFELDRELVEATEDGIRIGFPISVDYTGELDPNTQGQAVDISAIRVMNFDGLTASEKSGHLLLTLSLEEEVGQMFIARCPNENAAETEAEYQFGGYILYADDFESRTPDEVRSLIDGIQSFAGIPMLMGVDEEGGDVTRISRFSQFRSEPFPSPQALYAAGGWEAITADALEKCALLKSLGINLNFAPVCDISTNADDYIYKRSFGQDAELTSTYVETVVEAMAGTGVGGVLKHFPGYGNNVDTHTGIANDTRPYETFEASDFLPFEAGIDAGAEAILVSHNIVECMDADYPASLSPEVHRILREELGFTGVIITDDLSMDAIKNFTGDSDAAVLAIEAGNDLLCCRYYEDQFTAVLNAVQNGDIPRSRIDESVLRILEWKIDLGIL